MNLTLLRLPSVGDSTCGYLYQGNEMICCTMEDKIRPQKIAGKTCIPAGMYNIIINRSNRFGRDLPLLLDVPNYTGVRIHPGNTAADTEGCILPGTGMVNNFQAVTESRKAFEKLFAMMQAATGPITIDIINPKE